MRYLDITLGYQPGQGLIYPENYQTEIGNFSKDHLYYDAADGTAKLLLCIRNSDFKQNMIRVGVIEVTEAEAKAISEANETRKEEIKDEAKVRRIEIKSRLGMALTTDELDAIDPTKPNSVFGISEILADRINSLKTKESVK